MNQCSEIETRLCDAVDGDLDEAERAALEAHVARCPHCGQMWDSLQRTVALLRSIGRRRRNCH